jgi:hypothetical protein
VFSQDSRSEPTPVLMMDPTGDALTLFDAASRTASRIRVPRLGEQPFPPPVASQIGGAPGKPIIKPEKLGVTTVNGIECVRSRLTQGIENQAALHSVDEICVSQDLGLIIEL